MSIVERTKCDRAQTHLGMLLQSRLHRILIAELDVRYTREAAVRGRNVNTGDLSQTLP